LKGRDSVEDSPGAGNNAVMGPSKLGNESLLSSIKLDSLITIPTTFLSRRTLHRGVRQMKARSALKS
jgi:hypothetical protein